MNNTIPLEIISLKISSYNEEFFLRGKKKKKKLTLTSGLFRFVALSKAKYEIPAGSLLPISTRKTSPDFIEHTPRIWSPWTGIYWKDTVDYFRSIQMFTEIEIGFNSTSTCLGLFNVERLGNHIHWMFIFSFLLRCFLKKVLFIFFFLPMVLLKTNSF